MTDRELREWWCLLGLTDSTRAATVRTLLRYACEDEMTAADRTLCERALQRWAPAPDLLTGGEVVYEWVIPA